MSKIHFLPVRHGDCLVIECDQDGNHGVVVVDGGPSGGGKKLAAKLKEVGTPDLMMLTHYDDDHIKGLLQYFDMCNESGGLPAKEVWGNCIGYVDPKQDERKGMFVPYSPIQGVTLAKWMNGFKQRNGLEFNDHVVEGMTMDYDFASFEVVSPTEHWRDLAKGKQEKEVDNVEDPEMKAVSPMKMTRSLDVKLEPKLTPMEELAKNTPKGPSETVDSNIANASSIAVILRTGDMSMLLLGDSYPQTVEAYLRSQKYSEDNPLKVDFVKVAHHGSEHNTSNELLDIIQCDHYLISTNGEQFGHPHREAIAHILCHPKRDRSRKVHLYFNTDLATIEKNGKRKFITAGEDEEYNFEVHEFANEILPLDHGSDQAAAFGRSNRETIEDMAPTAITKDVLDWLTEEAKASPRLRMNLDLRNSPEDQSQRMLNAIEPGSILPVHRHKNTSETVVVLRGSLIEVFFDEDGGMMRSFHLGADSDSIGLNIPAGQWHVVESKESGTVLLEMKDGPYEPLADDDKRELPGYPLE